VTEGMCLFLARNCVVPLEFNKHHLGDEFDHAELSCDWNRAEEVVLLNTKDEECWIYS
jgi:hypothetical protein